MVHFSWGRIISELLVGVVLTAAEEGAQTQPHLSGNTEPFEGLQLCDPHSECLWGPMLWPAAMSRSPQLKCRFLKISIVTHCPQWVQIVPPALIRQPAEKKSNCHLWFLVSKRYLSPRPGSLSISLVNLPKNHIHKKREPSCTVGGNVNWSSHYGEQYGGSLKN